ncbi:hypothetical protein ACTFIU_010205 [Dictyostelium citrinum]
MEDIKTIENESNNRFNNILKKYNESKSIINEEFQLLYQMIKSLEIEINKECDEIFDLNKQVYNDFKNLINNNSKNDSDYFNNEIKNQIYKYQDLSFKLSKNKINDSLNSIKNSIKNSFKLNRKDTFSKIIKYDQTIFFNYDGIKIDDNIENLAFSENILELPKEIPKNIVHLWLMNGFKKDIKVGYIPDTVKFLSIWNIDKDIELSIPPTIECLYLGKGFEKKLSYKLIPSTINQLQLGKLSSELDESSIPLGIREVMFSDGFNKQIKKDILPSTVTTLNICDIKLPLLPNGESIPNTIKQLWFCDSFNHPLLKGNIPTTIEELYLCDIKQPLSTDSIPNCDTIELHLCDNFSQPLSPGIIPNSIKNLNIYNINSNLEVGSIPSPVNGLESLVFHDGFSKPLTKDTIPSNVHIKYLIIHDIATKLEIGSIPNDGTISELHLCSGFSQQISSLIIPIATLDQLYINDINYKKV